MINIQNLIDDAKCYETVRTIRWPGGVKCPQCGSADIRKRGRDEQQKDPNGMRVVPVSASSMT